MAQLWYQQLFLWMQEKHRSLDKARTFLLKKKDIWAMGDVFWEFKVYIETRFLQAVLQNCSVETSIGKQMYWFAVQRIAGDQRYVVHKKIT